MNASGNRPLSNGVVIAAILVVVVVAGFFLFRAMTAKEEARMDPNSAALAGMREINERMQQQIQQSRSGQPAGAPPAAGISMPPSALPPGVLPSGQGSGGGQ